MPAIQHVARKNETYYFRRLIRLGVDKPFRVRISLLTTDHERARFLAPALTVRSEALRMNMIGNLTSDGLTGQQRQEIYRRQLLQERDRLARLQAHLQLGDHEYASDILPEAIFRSRLEALEQVHIDRIRNGDKGAALIAIIRPDENEPEGEIVELVCWQDYEAPSTPQAVEIIADEHLSALKLPISELNRRMAITVIHAAKMKAVQEQRALIENPLPAYQTIPLHEHETASDSGAPTPLQPISPPASPAVEAGSKWALLTASQASLSFIEANPKTGGLDGQARKRGNSWDAKTREQFKLPALLLEQVMGGRPLSSISQEDLLRLDRHFQGLHGPSFRKSERQRAMSIGDIVKETEALVKAGKLDRNEIGLGIGTTNRHWGFLRQLTEWFKKKHPLADLDYSAFLQEDNRDPRDQQDVYSADEGRVLFSLPPWTGCESLRNRLKPGGQVIHDSCYFVPLIAWYTGLRRAEICGLNLADIVDEGDAPSHFIIRDNEARGVKTSSSRRLVPIAQELIRLNFLHYVTALRKADEILLFPELAYERTLGATGDAFYKNHGTKIARHLPFLERGQAIHSFRHTVTNELKSQQVFEEGRADLIGHKLRSETAGRYSKASGLSSLQTIVGKIPKVTDMLTPHPLNLLPSELRKPRKARRPAHSRP